MRMVTTHKQDYQAHYDQLREGLKLIKMLVMREEKEACWCKNRGACDICGAKEAFKKNSGLLSRIIDAEEDIYYHLDDFGVLTFPSYPAAVEKSCLGSSPKSKSKHLTLIFLPRPSGTGNQRSNMNSKEYKMDHNKSALHLEHANLVEALKGLEYCLDNDNYQNGYLASWMSGNPSTTVTRISGLLAQQNLLIEQIQEENK